MFNDIGEKCFIDTRVLIGHHGLDSVIYPQNAETYNNLHKVMNSTRKLSKGQEGVYYDALS